MGGLVHRELSLCFRRWRASGDELAEVLFACGAASVTFGTVGSPARSSHGWGQRTVAFRAAALIFIVIAGGRLSRMKLRPRTAALLQLPCSHSLAACLARIGNVFQRMYLIGSQLRTFIKRLFSKRRHERSSVMCVFVYMQCGYGLCTVR